MAERKAWWEILRDQFASRGLLDPESERVQETARALPAVKRQARGLLSLDPQAESDTALEMGLGALPGVGQAMALRDLERARRAKDPAAAAMAASNFIPFGALLNRFRRGPISELDVYHGTPHRFPATEANPLGEFDASKIGTGEGAQAYGHGIYLAETPEVAMGYAKGVKDMGSVRAINDELSALSKTMQADEIGGHYRQYRSDIGRNAAKRYDELLEQRQKVIDQPGNLLKADLPDEMIDRMLDWDKPLSEQHPEVQRIISEEIKRIGGGSAHTGERAYKELMFEARMQGNKSGSSAMKNNLEAVEASKRLQALGIPGIKYLDAGSRGQGGTGTRNFVVFPGEEKKVKILERK